MKKFMVLISLLFVSSVALCQWDDEVNTYSKKKQQEIVTYSRQSNDASSSYQTSYEGIPELSSDAKEALITNFDAALQRRLYAMKRTTEHEESYWEIMESYYHFLRNSYDKNLYNVIAINDQVWVEPQYITAMFNGSDPAQGVNEYIEVLFKEKRLEARKQEEKKSNYSYSVGFGIGFGFGSWWWGPGWHWGFYDPWWGPWGPYSPWWGPGHWWGPWGPYDPWWGPRPWGPGPWHPWGPVGPWGGRPSHPVYFGNSPHGVGGGRGMFSPSPSLRSPGVTRGGNTGGNPFGAPGQGSFQGGSSKGGPQQTKGGTPQSKPSSGGNRNYRNNTAPASRPSSGSFRGGGFSGPSSFGGGGGGGFHGVGGGGYRR